MEAQSRKHFGWGYLILGILLVITSLIAFRDPFSDILALAVLFGIMAILSGSWLFVNNDGGHTVLRIIAGVLDILIGIALLINPWAGALAMPVLFAVWFIVSSMYGITRLVRVKQNYGTGHFWFALVINILCVIAGVLLLFHPFVSLLTISFLAGFYFMMAGFEAIVYAFSYTRDNDTP